MRRVRRSTWVLLAIFLLALATYILVRPETVTNGHSGAGTSSVATSTSTTTTTLRLVP
jgi:hypothetical protein